MKKNKTLTLVGVSKNGFTLIEILISLFIFTLISLMLMHGLKNIIETLSTTENQAERLRQLQMALLLLSRDIEQTVNRPVIDGSGKTEPAFIGSANQFMFTHTGVAHANNKVATSALQRVAYRFQEKKLERVTLRVLDQPPKPKTPPSRHLLENVTDAHFEYLGEKGAFYSEWPLGGKGGEALPRAIRMYLTLHHLGSMTQLFLIPAEASHAAANGNQPGQAEADKSEKSDKSDKNDKNESIN